MSASNTEKGKQVKLSIFDTGESDFLPLCYLTSKDITVDLPMTGTTNQCTAGNYTDGEWTGYKTFTLNISGNADLNPDSPTFYAYQSLLDIVYDNAGVDPRAKFELDDAFATTVSTFNISNFNETGAEEEHRTFTMTLQVTGDDLVRTNKVL